MARFSSGRTQHLTHRLARYVGLWMLAWLVGLGAAAPASALDLLGTWHVTIHYKDELAGNPDAERWLDRVWALSPEGSRLKWIDYPLVVLEDPTGRFERLSTNRASRMLSYWEPTEDQLAEILSGPKVNSRGSKTKTLRGSATEGWRSRSAGRAASASIVTYSETWIIEDPSHLPVFIRSDSMGSGRSDTLEGETRYETEVVEPGGDVLRGSYQRDGTQQGTFIARRTAPVRGLGSQEEQEERIRRKRVAGAVQQYGTGSEGRAEIRKALEQNGVYLSDPDVDALAAEAAVLIQEGVTLSQVTRRLAGSALDKYVASMAKYLPESGMGAPHDSSARYRFPFDGPRKLIQGVNGELSHRGASKYSFDFEMPVGTPIRAAREGVVVRVVDGFTEGGRNRTLAGKANVVSILHADGTVANYIHLSPGIEVKLEQRVKAGDLLGKSGNTGFTTTPHLHFSVWRRDPAEADLVKSFRSVEIRFDDGSSAGVVPVEGLTYGGQSSAAR